MESEFKYILELSGTDYTKVKPADPQYAFPAQFKEQNFYFGIQEAVEELILRDVRRFEKFYYKIETGHHYNSGQIVSAVNSLPILTVRKLPFQGPPDKENDLVFGGIYMDFGEKTVRDFEALSDFDFYFQNNYDPNSRYLELALYVDDTKYGQGLYQEFMTGDWLYNLKVNRENKTLFENRWKYKVEITEKAIDAPQSPEIRRYHFYTLPEASQFFFLSTDINRMDEDFARQRKDAKWVSSATLEYKYHGKIAELVSSKKYERDRVILEPGIHLQSHIPIQQLEKLINIDLSGLENYLSRENCLLVGNYYQKLGIPQHAHPDSGKIILHPSYATLLSKLSSNILAGKQESIQEKSSIEQRKITGTRSLQSHSTKGPKL